MIQIPVRAKGTGVCEVSQQIINSAKVEVDLVKAVNASAPGSTFFGVPDDGRELPKIETAKPRFITGGKAT